MPTTNRMAHAIASGTYVSEPFFPLSDHDRRRASSGTISTLVTPKREAVYAPPSMTGAHTSSGVARNVAEPDATWARGLRPPKGAPKRMSAKRLAAMIRAIRMGETRDD